MHRDYETDWRFFAVAIAFGMLALAVGWRIAWVWTNPSSLRAEPVVVAPDAGSSPTPSTPAPPSPETVGDIPAVDPAAILPLSSGANAIEMTREAAVTDHAPSAADATPPPPSTDLPVPPSAPSTPAPPTAPKASASDAAAKEK